MGLEDVSTVKLASIAVVCMACPSKSVRLELSARHTSAGVTALWVIDGTRGTRIDVHDSGIICMSGRWHVVDAGSPDEVRHVAVMIDEVSYDYDEIGLIRLMNLPDCKELLGMYHAE